MNAVGTRVAVGALLGVAVVVAACNPTEQGRVLDYQKGVYLGKKEAPLSEATLKTLRARTAHQAGVVGSTVGSSSVRPPDAKLDIDALRRRNLDQRDRRI